MSGPKIIQLELGPMANFVYLIADAQTKNCAVVDPAWDVPEILRVVKENGFSLSCALVTHNHPDHVNGLSALMKAADVPIYVNKNDAHALGAFKENLRQSSGGDKVKIGGLELTLLHTPGHTAGSQCLMAHDQLLTGDTLFIGSCGRVDLPTSDPGEMYQTLRNLAKLPDKTVIFPGHHYSEELSATLKDQKDKNPFLKVSSTMGLEEFLRLVGA